MRSNAFLFLLCAPAAVHAVAPIVSSYAKFPLAFERQGMDSRGRFVARGSGYTIAVQEGNAAIGIQSLAGDTVTVSLQFAGAQKVAGIAGPQLPGRVNYLLGDDPKRWRLSLPTYESVRYREVYPAIDVVYRGNQRQMEFDLVLRPGADPKKIRLKFDEIGRAACREKV